MNLQHHFLIAMPTLDDPNFGQSLVYLCENNESGAMGLIINKPLDDLNVDEFIQKLDVDINQTISPELLHQQVMNGGPVSSDRGFVLHTPLPQLASSIQVTNELMITSSKDIFQTLGTDQQPSEILFALGYCVWSSGQLEQEIKDNSWLVVEADLTTLFHTPIHERWQTAARKLGVNIHTIAREMGTA